MYRFGFVQAVKLDEGLVVGGGGGGGGLVVGGEGWVGVGSGWGRGIWFGGNKPNVTYASRDAHALKHKQCKSSTNYYSK